MVAVNSSRDLTSTVGDFLKSFNWTASNRPSISRPFHDTASRGGSMVMVSWPSWFRDSIMIVNYLLVFKLYLCF